MTSSKSQRSYFRCSVIVPVRPPSCCLLRMNIGIGLNASTLNDTCTCLHANTNHMNDSHECYTKHVCTCDRTCDCLVFDDCACTSWYFRVLYLCSYSCLCLLYLCLWSYLNLSMFVLMFTFALVFVLVFVSVLRLMVVLVFVFVLLQ